MLKAKDIWDEQEERKLNRMSAMGPVIIQLQKKIREQAVHNPNAPYVVYEVPTYVFGYPLYQLSDAVQYLVSELMKAGYWIWVVDDKYLVVSWMKPVKTRDGGKPILTTNYRPQAYDPSFFSSMDNQK